VTDDLPPVLACETGAIAERPVYAGPTGEGVATPAGYSHPPYVSEKREVAKHRCFRSSSSRANAAPPDAGHGSGLRCHGDIAAAMRGRRKTDKLPRSISSSSGACSASDRVAISADDHIGVAGSIAKRAVNSCRRGGQAVNIMCATASSASPVRSRHQPTSRPARSPQRCRTAERWPAMSKVIGRQFSGARAAGLRPIRFDVEELRVAHIPTDRGPRALIVHPGCHPFGSGRRV